MEGQPAQVAEPDPLRPVRAPAMGVEERLRLPAPQIAAVAQQLRTELGEVPDAEPGRHVRSPGVPLGKAARGIQIQRHEPLVRVADEGEGEVVGIEVQHPGFRLGPAVQHAAVPPGLDHRAAVALRRQPLAHARARAFGHAQEKAAVAVRDHAARAAAAGSGKGGAAPSSPASAGHQPGRTASAWARKTASSASQVCSPPWRTRT